MLIKWIVLIWLDHWKVSSSSNHSTCWSRIFLRKMYWEPAWSEGTSRTCIQRRQMFGVHLCRPLTVHSYGWVAKHLPTNHTYQLETFPPVHVYNMDPWGFLSKLFWRFLEVKRENAPKEDKCSENSALPWLGCQPFWIFPPLLLK